MHRIQKSFVRYTIFDSAVQRSHRKGGSLFFLAADGENDWNILQLGLSHFFVQTLRPAVDLSAQPGIFKRCQHFVGIRHQIIVDRQDNGLQRCQPQRKFAGKMFDENAQKSAQ